jgi:hypothetical protein
MMRGKLPGIVVAPAHCVVALLAATLLPATTRLSAATTRLSPVVAQTVARQSRAPRTTTPSTPRPSPTSSTSSSPTSTPRPSPPTARTDAEAPSRDSQTQRPSEPARRSSAPGAADDISITAHVTADSLRFEKVPNPRVEFTGRPRRDTVWEAQRENLPPQVQPGVTYRNVGITLRITSVFADIDRIVAEALGEVPASDEAQPTPAQPTPTPPTQPIADNPSAVSTTTRRRPAHRGGRN